MKKLILLLSCFSLLCFAKCNKDKIPRAELPPATQEGKNIIGFTIDDEVWVPYAKCAAFSNPCGEILARYGTSGGTAPNGIDFGFTRIRNDKRSDLTISSAGIGTMSSLGNKADSILVSYRDENASGNTGDYSGPLTGSKFMVTKIDFQNQIISGEFELILIEQNGSGKTITLKDGRFDLKFNACKCSN